MSPTNSNPNNKTTPPLIPLRAQCLCKAQTFTTRTLPISTLPLKASSCHCTSCRHVTGALRSSDAVWPGPAEEIRQSIQRPGGLRRYQHSGPVNVLFCGGCGAGMFFEEFASPVRWSSSEGDGTGAEGDGGGGEKDGRGGQAAEYLVFTGVLSAEYVDEDRKGEQVMMPLVRWEDHIFVADTVDGGAAYWLRGMNGDGGERVKVWLGGRDKSQEVQPGVQWPAFEDLPSREVNLKAAEGDKANVHIRCHCRGVDLVLHAREAQREFEEMQKQGQPLPWFVDPVTHKLLGSFDACDSCRIWSGSEVFNWTFSLLRHIFFAGDNSEGFPRDTFQLRAAVEETDGRSRDPRLGTLALYASSPDVQRYFCGRCSASVFYAVDDRPDMVDVAVGVLDSQDGARAESAISWSFGGPMSWRQDMAGTWREGVLQAVEREVKDWRIERGYPKSWRRVEGEQSEQQGGA